MKPLPEGRGFKGFQGKRSHVPNIRIIAPAHPTQNNTSPPTKKTSPPTQPLPSHELLVPSHPMVPTPVQPKRYHSPVQPKRYQLGSGIPLLGSRKPTIGVDVDQAGANRLGLPPGRVQCSGREAMGKRETRRKLRQEEHAAATGLPFPRRWGCAHLRLLSLRTCSV